MPSPEEKLSSLGVTLPSVPKPLGAYVPCVRAGNLLFLSGQLPLVDGKLVKSGSLGKDVSIEEGGGLARICAINAVAVVKAEVGELSRIKRCVKLTGFVASAEGFFDQPKVINGASEFMAEVFGEAGRHARAAVGVSALPLNSPLEIDFIFELA